jgi:hypothetical protein
MGPGTLGTKEEKLGGVKCFLVNVKIKLNMQNPYQYAWKRAIFGHFYVFACNVICKNVLWV